jgi:hypothetical protein
MVNWYYVDGTERVGPVSLNEFQALVKDGKIDHETYVWKKGFANWERFKNVEELQFISEIKPEEILISNSEEIINKAIVEEVAEELKEELNVELKEEIRIESFSWNSFDKSASRFFLKIGHDRINSTTNSYGPYTFHEILEAYKEKRINEKTLIFTFGLDTWYPISSIVLLREELKIDNLLPVVQSTEPIYFLQKLDGKYNILLLKSYSNLSMKLLTNSILDSSHELILSLYQGSKKLSEDVKLKVIDVNRHEQLIIADLIEANEEAKRIINEFN